VIVDAVQNAMNEIARRGYLTTYAGALPAWQCQSLIAT
jgi:hypothetical protein